MNSRSRVVVASTVVAILLAVPTAAQASAGGWRDWIWKLSGPGTSGNGVTFALCLNRVTLESYPDSGKLGIYKWAVGKACRDHPVETGWRTNDSSKWLARTSISLRGAYSKSTGDGELANNVQFTRTFWEPAIEFSNYICEDGFCSRFRVLTALGLGFHSFSGPGVDFDRRSADLDLKLRFYLFKASQRSGGNWGGASLYVEGAGRALYFGEAITLEDFGGPPDDVQGGEWAVGYSFALGVAF